MNDYEAKCIFCDIIQGTQEAIVIFENSLFISIMDKFPINRGHLLVLPKQHYPYITDMKKDDVSKLFEIVSILTNVIWSVVHADGVNIGQSNGKAASQDIFHVHVHIIPRFNDDTGHNFWPPRKNFTYDELKDISIQIKNQLKKNNIKLI